MTPRNVATITVRMALINGIKSESYVCFHWRSNSVPNVYKNLNHRVKNFESNLSGDIEKNPGPVINSTKKIQAPYSQNNVAMFGLNAGTQCVATLSLAVPHI